MKQLPLAYVLRSLWVRRLTTLLTAASMGLVVFVFAAVLMMSDGIQATLVTTGSPDNLLVLRKGAGAEIHSSLTREQAAVVASLSGIARGPHGEVLAEAEAVVLASLPRRTGGYGNLTLRGSGARGLALRPQVRLVQGRMFQPGTTELIIGQATTRGYAHAALGDRMHFAGRDWPVVGVFEAQGSGFDSELWTDAGSLMQAFRRNTYSTVVLALPDEGGRVTGRAALEADTRLGVHAPSEPRFYAEQSEQMTDFIRLLGLSMSLTFAGGAVAGAMITMFAAVATRSNEIGTLRALGFSRAAVLAAFLSESLLIALAGGLAGIAAAAVLSGMKLATTNFQTFAEMEFRLQLSVPIALACVLFAITMGLLGGFLPACRTARLNIVDALRAR